MNNLPQKIIFNILNFKNKYPIIFATTLVIPLVLFLFFLSYSTPLKLNKNEIKINEFSNSSQENTYEGRVTFRRVENSKNIYDLISETGEFIAILRSDDQKLDLVEGLYVQIKGRFFSGQDNTEDTILVDEVILKSNN